VGLSLPSLLAAMSANLFQLTVGSWRYFFVLLGPRSAVSLYFFPLLFSVILSRKVLMLEMAGRAAPLILFPCTHGRLRRGQSEIGVWRTSALFVRCDCSCVVLISVIGDSSARMAL